MSDAPVPEPIAPVSHAVAAVSSSIARAEAVAVAEAARAHLIRSGARDDAAAKTKRPVGLLQKMGSRISRRGFVDKTPDAAFSGADFTHW